MNCNSRAIEYGNVKPDAEYIANMKGKFFIIDDTYELSEIFAKVMSIKPDVVVLDYIGLVTVNKLTESSMYDEYAKSVQKFVKKTKTAWIDLSNLPKDADEDTMRIFGGFYGSSFLRNNTDVGIHMMKYKPFFDWKSKMEDNPNHSKMMEEDRAYRNRMQSVKALSVVITKNRI